MDIRDLFPLSDTRFCSWCKESTDDPCISNQDIHDELDKQNGTLTWPHLPGHPEYEKTRDWNRKFSSCGVRLLLERKLGIRKSV